MQMHTRILLLWILAWPHVTTPINTYRFHSYTSFIYLVHLLFLFPQRCRPDASSSKDFAKNLLATCLIISWNLIFLNESILSLSSLIIETISLKYALVIFQIQSGKLNLKFKLVSSFREKK